MQRKGVQGKNVRWFESRHPQKRSHKSNSGHTRKLTGHTKHLLVTPPKIIVGVLLLALPHGPHHARALGPDDRAQAYFPHSQTPQDHPPSSFSDGTWPTSQHDIAAEWVSHCEKRHAGFTSTPQHIISDADRSAVHFAHVHRPCASSSGFRQATASQSLRRRSSPSRALQVPSCAFG